MRLIIKLLESSLPKRKKDPPDIIKRKLADTSTLYSERIVSLRLQISKPIEALQAIYLCSYYKYWQTDILIRSIAHRAYANCYQGKWQLVQEVLELEDQSPERLEQYLIAKNPFEFYGNILPGALKIEHRVAYKTPVSEKRKGVKRYNSCEYRDKGTRRLPHEYHGDPPQKEEREDRRNRVSHPLLKEEVKEENPNTDSGYAIVYIQEKGETRQCQQLT